MKRAIALALAAATVAIPGAPAGAASHHGHHKAQKRHYTDQRVRMRAHRPPHRPPFQRPPGTPTPPPQPKPLSRMQVVAREFSLTLSRQTVTAGAVAIELNNHGEDPHDLRVERTDDALSGFNFTLTNAGAIATRKLELGPGTWRLYCTLDGHAALGMSATFTVDG